MGRKNAARLEILSGWKEIADYLGMGVRTVQRYEQELGLPIRRPAGKSSVIAVKAELDRWVSASPLLRADARSRRLLAGQTNKVGADFLQVDCEIGLTFSAMAFRDERRGKKSTIDPEGSESVRHRHASQKKIVISEAEREKLDANLQRLKSELQRLGEHF